MRIRAGNVTPLQEGVRTGEMKAKVRHQVRAELEQQVHPMHTLPQPSRANCGVGNRNQGSGRKVEKILEKLGQRQSKEAAGEQPACACAQSEDSPRPRWALELPRPHASPFLAGQCLVSNSQYACRPYPKEGEHRPFAPWEALLSGEQRGKGSRGSQPPSLNTNGYQVSDTSALRTMRWQP